MSYKYLLLIFTIFSLAVSAGEIKKFELKGGSLSFAVPQNWQEAKKLFGVQLMLLSPMQGKNRSVLTVESTDFSAISFDAQALKKNEASYQEGRKKWLSKYQGEVLQFYSYETIKLGADKTDAHAVGYRYKIQDKEFTERSYFFKCQKTLFHMKFLFPLNEENQYKTEIEELMKTLSCSSAGKKV